MIGVATRLAIAAIVGSVTSLTSFVACMLAMTFIHGGSFPLVDVANYSIFVVFFFAGFPIFGVAICGGIPLFLLFQNKSLNHARAKFLVSGALAGAVAAVAGWYFFWNTFGLLIGLAGAAAGIAGALTFWQIADSARSRSAL